MEQPIELVVGLSFLITGLSVIFNQKEWLEFIKYAERKGSWIVMAVGMADLLFGGFIVAFHWTWKGLGGITTAIGMILFIRGVMRLLFPSWVLGKISNAKTLLTLLGFTATAISLIILLGWYLDLTFYGLDFSKIYSNERVYYE
jgi:hypothetical protein